MADAPDMISELYPFLRGPAEEDRALDPALEESIAQKAAESVAVKQRFFADNGAKLVDVAHAVAEAYRGGGRLFAMGNGGSSCDAAHIAVEFTHPVTTGRPALPAVNLAADAAMMTAVGNDVGFRDIFVRQIIAHARAGDAIIGVSTSGSSENVLAGFATAKRIGLTTVALVGSRGGVMARSPEVDHCLVVPSDSIHRIQECHVAIYHILWDLVHTLLATSRGSAAAGTAAR
jgi:D-sedoheptulose 7-phosphate isomerase